MTKISEIPPQSGVAFRLKKGERLKIIDPFGKQVSDMVLFNPVDLAEKISAGKTFDFESTLLLTTGHYLWSNRSRKLMRISADTCGRHDFLLAPCSKETFEILYDEDLTGSPSCHGNLSMALESFGVRPDDVPTAFNVFMNVAFAPTGELSVLPPLSRPGDYVIFEALTDLLVGLTSCSAGKTNDGKFKPIHYVID